MASIQAGIARLPGVSHGCSCVEAGGQQLSSTPATAPYVQGVNKYTLFTHLLAYERHEATYTPCSL
jgi:hypothetical protein